MHIVSQIFAYHRSSNCLMMCSSKDETRVVFFLFIITDRKEMLLLLAAVGELGTGGTLKTEAANGLWRPAMTGEDRCH